MPPSTSQPDEGIPSLPPSDHKTSDTIDGTRLSRERWELKTYTSDMIDAFRSKVAAGAEIPAEMEEYRQKFASRMESQATSSTATTEKWRSNSLGVADGLRINAEHGGLAEERSRDRSEVLYKLHLVAAPAHCKSGWLAELLDKEYWREMGHYGKWARMYEFVYGISVEERVKQDRKLWLEMCKEVNSDCEDDTE
ncbi:hypothetical protein BU16DRAFT_561046 [Lophium mytilinum]|uniref:Uncharacterized protein n=1 Tax=Lophium mytilinum TaxID=390894 RepID=A0A6A6QVN0_9PEZI|nr:hypothetical protein BU16DRAFT_561046 [Lophium mytilinum]